MIGTPSDCIILLVALHKLQRMEDVCLHSDSSVHLAYFLSRGYTHHKHRVASQPEFSLTPDSNAITK
jgi:hypothetical protein